MAGMLCPRRFVHQEDAANGSSGAGSGAGRVRWTAADPVDPKRKPFKRAVEHAELPEEMRIHDLRHSFASLFLLDGGDIFKLSKILGHRV
jgi:integrase